MPFCKIDVQSLFAQTETIYVRVFEERMDLMRAAIVSASGTPYHDGLFFFDICFPPEYPSEPPVSFGMLFCGAFIILFIYMHVNSLHLAFNILTAKAAFLFLNKLSSCHLTFVTACRWCIIILAGYN